MSTYRYVIHRKSRALWPEHTSVEALEKLKITTPPNIWNATYMANPTPEGGQIFQEDWWGNGRNRYNVLDRVFGGKVIARSQFWDTAETGAKSTTAAFSACTTFDILDDWRILLRDTYQKRVEFDGLTDIIATQARKWNHDGKLRDVIVEYKSSGTQAYQSLSKPSVVGLQGYKTLNMASPDWLRGKMRKFRVKGNKRMYAELAAVWCQPSKGMVLLPLPHDTIPWLMDFEDELWPFPEGRFVDRADSFSKHVVFWGNHLAQGFQARNRQS